VLVFLLLVPGFRLAGRRHRTAYVILSSLLLAWATIGAAYVALLVAATVLAWTVIGATRSALVRHSSNTRGIVALGVAALVIPYTGFLLFPQPAWLPRVEVPVYFYLQWAGLAYLTLKAIQVILDLGHERAPRPRLGAFAAFLLFAPTLRMGPIYRWADFCRDLEDSPTGEAGAVRGGFDRLAIGLFKLGLMAVLLNNFPAADVFDTPHTLGTGALLLHIYAQPMSIYLWIAGYSDLAIGLGRLGGFRVPENFDSPWLSRSVREFWRRWHISLSTWLRDYVYIPLGGNRRHVSLNYFVTFTLVGAWHGLVWSYILWGLSQGLGLSVNNWWRRFWQRHRERESGVCRIARRCRILDGPLGSAAGWLLTFHYQVLTIAVFMDEKHAGAGFLGELLRRLAG
jgi:alginate O-acetyltransferase complex protein AlgI